MTVLTELKATHRIKIYPLTGHRSTGKVFGDQTQYTSWIFMVTIPLKYFQFVPGHNNSKDAVVVT